MKAVVNKIIPFSAVDGPGNRTALFLQGCNLDCRYCHNPETLHICKECGVCAEFCRAGALVFADGHMIYDAARCVGCDTCIHICPHGSSPKTREMTVDEICSQIEKYRPFIRGLTVSGGECTMQAEFLEALFPRIRDMGLSILLDSNGTYDLEGRQRLLSLIDGVMLDVKAFDEEEHRRVTGHGNALILKNLVYLAGQKKLNDIRTVIVPELFDGEKTVHSVARAIPQKHRQSICYKLIAYRQAGVREAYRGYRSPSDGEMRYLAQCLESYGFKEIIII